VITLLIHNPVSIIDCIQLEDIDNASLWW